MQINFQEIVLSAIYCIFKQEISVVLHYIAVKKLFSVFGVH